MIKEFWKDIPCYEGLYQASVLGGIRSLNYNNTKIIKNLKFGVNLRGYFCVNLCKNKICKHFRVHRIISETFIENINNKPQVNHIDGDKKNNNISNLEWVTNQENTIHSYKKLGRKGYWLGKKGIENHQSVKINQYESNGNFIKMWDSISDAGRFYNIPHGNISKVCKFLRKTAGGYSWRYFN